MLDGSPPRIVRLNARTLPLSDTERSLLATVDAELIEAEGATDAEILAACRDADAILIVSAHLRGTVIRYAALDVFGIVNVFGEEGFPTDHALFRLNNVLLTPHMAAASEETAIECQRRSAQAVVEVLSGRWPEHPVNPEVTPWFARETRGD